LSDVEQHGVFSAREPALRSRPQLNQIDLTRTEPVEIANGAGIDRQPRQPLCRNCFRGGVLSILCDQRVKALASAHYYVAFAARNLQ